MGGHGGLVMEGCEVSCQADGLFLSPSALFRSLLPLKVRVTN